MERAIQQVARLAVSATPMTTETTAAAEAPTTAREGNRPTAESTAASHPATGAGERGRSSGGAAAAEPPAG